MPRSTPKKRLNERPVTAIKGLTIDKDCINKLRSQNLSLASRLEQGRTIVVKHAVNENSSRGNHTVTNQAHPDTAALGSWLIKDLGLHPAGMDIICKDISAPLTRSNACMGEINIPPGINHHYLIASPDKGVPVAELILEYLFTSRQGVMLLGTDNGDDRSEISYGITQNHAAVS